MAAERYDLAVRRDALELQALRALLEVMRDERFREQVHALGGYDAGRAGDRLL